MKANGGPFTPRDIGNSIDSLPSIKSKSPTNLFNSANIMPLVNKLINKSPYKEL
jgi:hypothetical protein